MTGIVILSAGVLILGAFIVGIVFGVHVASGRAIRANAQRRRETTTAEALAADLGAELAAIRAELAARPAFPAYVPHTVIAVPAEGGHAPAFLGAAPALPSTVRPEINGGNRK